MQGLLDLKETLMHLQDIPTVLLDTHKERMLGRKLQLKHLKKRKKALTLTTMVQKEWNAVVTGGNKGIGFEICRQLASNGVTVVLTARDEKRGLEAVEKLRDYGLSHLIVFHQLDVTDPASVASLADFIKTKFGKLDILVNNAAICGVKLNPDALTKALERFGGWPQREQANWDEIAAQTFEMAEECLNTNYYGAKRTVETLIPLLRLSDSARIVNVSASLGSLKYIPNEEVKGVLNDVENLTEDTIDELLNKFLKDLEEKSLEKEGWPTHFSAYTISKTFMNAYARILAKKHPNLLVNSVCPGYVKTDINCNTGVLTPLEGAQGAVRLALLPRDGSSGLFFCRNELSHF